MDQQRQPNALAHESRAPVSPFDSATGFREATKQLKQLAATAPASERAKFERMLEEAGPIIAYLDRQESVEAASTALEPYREQFIRFSKNEKAYLRQAATIFAEDRFAPLRFTAAEVGKALDRVGYVSSTVRDETTADKLRDAILSLADRQRRRELSLGLISHLPDYIAAGRFMDGWIVQSLANDTLESETESNPFLFHMFAFGYDGWIEKQRCVEEAILRDIGIDIAHLRNSSLEEIDELLRTHASDPAMQAKMEKVLKANPDAEARSIAQLQQMERESLSLLEGDDANDLLLPENEVEPWLPVVLQRWGSAAQSLAIGGDESPSDDAVDKIVKQAVYPFLTEMVQSIFTQERLGEFISKLKEFRNRRFAAGDKAAAGKAIGAIASLGRETKPECNFFLVALCFASVRRSISHAAARAEVQLQET